jgi:hypothetical protein
MGLTCSFNPVGLSAAMAQAVPTAHHSAKAIHHHHAPISRDRESRASRRANTYTLHALNDRCPPLTAEGQPPSSTPSGAFVIMTDPSRLPVSGMTGGDAFHPTRPFAWYVFAGFDGQAVAYDATLNGNLFQEQPERENHTLRWGGATRSGHHGLARALPTRMCCKPRNSSIRRVGCTSSARSPCRCAFGAHCFARSIPMKGCERTPPIEPTIVVDATQARPLVGLF